PGMRQCQVRLLAPLGTKGKKVEVDDPRTPMLVPLGPPHRGFDRVKLAHQRLRFELGQDASDSVDEVRLRHRPERTRAIELRRQHETGVRQLSEPRDGSEYLPARILEIAANADVGRLPAIHRADQWWVGGPARRPRGRRRRRDRGGARGPPSCPSASAMRPRSSTDTSWSRVHHFAIASGASPYWARSSSKS